ncbi:MAG: GH92 family glycosyl hydrolase [Cyclobacteriaceae bacterium]|nr:GH92 family glycosyl hydrolase [Cyclobacteriaceae bacterium]
MTTTLNAIQTHKSSCKLLALACFVFLLTVQGYTRDYTDYVNLFIGSLNEGNTNPGATMPWGMASISPFNAYDTLNPDAWCRSPYLTGRPYISGFTQLNISGTGCPDLGTFTQVATHGPLSFSAFHNASVYSNEVARPGYYSVKLDKFNIKAEMTATERSTLTRYTFPAGSSNIMVNLGLGLTTRDGAVIQRLSDTEIAGSKTTGNFCGLTNTQIVYFYARVSKKPLESGVWDGDRKYHWFKRPMPGKNIGAYFTFETEEGEQVYVQTGFSFVSVENAKLNLETEQKTLDFEAIAKSAENAWNRELSKIKVEGGSEDDKIKFYTALYHILIHPNVFNDVNGDYVGYESDKIYNAGNRNRYTIFSLWDTYRTVHPFLSLVYPKKQSDMTSSLVDMYREGGWLPRWELAGMETGVMVGDPSLPVIADTYLRGIRDFDINTAYEAMVHNATANPATNILRPGLEYWLKYDFIPDDAPPVMHNFPKDMYENMLRHRVVWGSVSTALEYSIADWSLAQLASALGKNDDYDTFTKRSMLYRNNFDAQIGFVRPKLSDGSWVSPFDPTSHNLACFTEGSAWTYTFMVPHDMRGLIKLMGGPKRFVNKLQQCFDEGHFDVTNEPDIAYPYLFNYVKGEEWRTQKTVREIVERDFKNAPEGIPGNEDVGTLSTWLVYSMMGFYPDCPANMEYQLTSPVFSKVTIELDSDYYEGRQFVIEAPEATPDNIYISSMRLNGKAHKKHTIHHNELVKGGKLIYNLTHTKP